MDKKIKRNLAGLALVACVMPLQASVMTEAGSAYALHQTTQTEQQKPKNQLLRSKKKAFFKTEEARRVGDQVLLWQRDTGGWPKNVDMESPMTEEQKQQVLADKKRKDDSTTDNKATSMQMYYLARLYQATGDHRYQKGFCKAVDYLLSGQYDNGGWPQFWPGQRDYQVHITFNDDAMVNTMEVLRDVYEGKAPFDGNLTSDKLKMKAKKAFDKGVECILKTQIRNPKPTVWCQQHDYKTFLPTKARAYELPSYCSQESAYIVRLLLSLPNPDDRVKEAVHGAMAWFEQHKITGKRLVVKKDAKGKKVDVQLVDDPNGHPLWARYYDLEKGEPYVCDRDGVPRKHLEEIGVERRTGYSWYDNERLEEIYPLYEAWKKQYDPEGGVMQ